MSVPKPNAAGVRVYHPDGIEEDKTRCAESVYSGGREMCFYQCSRKRGFGPEGIYCRQHNPAAVAARKKEADRRAYLRWYLPLKISAAKSEVVAAARQLVREGRKGGAWQKVQRAVSALDALIAEGG